MHFLNDVYINCESCEGSRYNSETLDVTYKGKNIAEVLAMTVDEATQFSQKYRKFTIILDLWGSWVGIH